MTRIYEAAAVSIGCPMDEIAGFQADLLVDRLEKISEKIEQTEGEIKDLCDCFPACR